MIDPTAAGHGWFVDPTPHDDTEFSDQDGDGELTAALSSPAWRRMDLLTAVIHELGHLLGLEHLDADTNRNDVMNATLEVGLRRSADETSDHTDEYTRQETHGIGNIVGWDYDVLQVPLGLGQRHLWPQARDTNRDVVIDRLDIKQVHQTGKYRAREAALWSNGDWTGDSRFDKPDVVAAPRTGKYLASPSRDTAQSHRFMPRSSTLSFSTSWGNLGEKTIVL